MAAITGDNIVDNVEQIYIELTVPGIYTVQVKHKGSLGNGQPFALLISYGSSLQGVVHVSTSGDDEIADGSNTNPFATIQAALDFSSMGDTILVAPGDYVENITMTNKNNIIASHFILNGDLNHITNTTLDGNGQGSILVMDRTGPNTKLIGFTITNGYTTDSGGGLYCIESYITIEHCRFIANSAGMTNTTINGGAIGAWESDMTLQNVTFIENVAAGKGAALFAAQSTVSGSHLFLYNNLGQDRGAGLALYESTGNFNHITIVHDSAQVAGGAVFMQESELTLASTILWDNSPQQIAFSAMGDPSIVNIHYSILDGLLADVETNNNGTLNFGLFNVFDTDPLFCDPDFGVFTLAENSPCIGTGTDGTNMGVFGIGCDSILGVLSTVQIPIYL